MLMTKRYKEPYCSLTGTIWAYLSTTRESDYYAVCSIYLILLKDGKGSRVAQKTWVLFESAFWRNSCVEEFFQLFKDYWVLILITCPHLFVVLIGIWIFYFKSNAILKYKTNKQKFSIQTRLVEKIKFCFKKSTIIVFTAYLNSLTYTKSINRVGGNIFLFLWDKWGCFLN